MTTAGHHFGLPGYGYTLASAPSIHGGRCLDVLLLLELNFWEVVEEIFHFVGVIDSWNESVHRTLYIGLCTLVHH